MNLGDEQTVGADVHARFLSIVALPIQTEPLRTRASLSLILSSTLNPPQPVTLACSFSLFIKGSRVRECLL